MKCVCGYEHEEGIDENGDWNEYIKGDKKFIKSKNSITVENFYSTSIEYIYACPKCGTLKINI